MKVNSKSSFTFIDLFAGIGGTRIAFEKSGAVCVFSSENDNFCKKTYSAFFGEEPYGDIRNQKISTLVRWLKTSTAFSS